MDGCEGEQERDETRRTLAVVSSASSSCSDGEIRSLQEQQPVLSLSV